MLKPYALDRIHLCEEDPQKLFEIEESIGVGNFGVVLKARHRITDEVVAVKQIPLNDTDAEDLNNIVKEVEILQHCDHPNIVRFYGTYESLGVLWIVMEFCEGGSVDTVYDLLRRPLSEKLIAYVCQQALQGLRYLHERHVIHRDVKGSNVLLTKAGQVKLADFGVSTELTHTLSRRNSFIGTALWMAPEALTEKDYDSRADMWSLGITTIELAEGQPPHLGMHIARVVFVIPLNDPPTLHAKERWSPQMHQFLRRLLTKDKELRPSAATMLSDPFVAPDAVATQAEMAAVVDQLLVKRRSMDKRAESRGKDSHASVLTIVTRASSADDEGEGEERKSDGTSSLPSVEVAAQWVDEQISPERGVAPPVDRAAVSEVGGLATAAASDVNRGPPLGGRLVLLPLLHLEDMPFDALSGCGRSLLNGGLTTVSSPNGSGQGGSVGLGGSPLAIASGLGAMVNSGLTPGNAAGGGGGVARRGLSAAACTAVEGHHGVECMGVLASSSNRHCHPSLLLPSNVAGGSASPAAPTAMPLPAGGLPPPHEVKMAAAAALGDPLAETLYLLGNQNDPPTPQCVDCFETTAMHTVRDVFLYYQHLPYTRAVSEAEAKDAQRMKSLCGTVLKNVYATTSEMKENL